MQHTIKILILLCWGTSAFCQFERSEIYYPENNIYIKNKVKTVTDSIFFTKPFIKTYDSLGRITSCYYEGATPTQYKYDQFGDTLLRFEFTVNTKIENIYATELFVYNKQGNILSYQSIRKNHYNQNQSDCKLHEFIYNDKGDLLFFHYYSNENYPAAYSQNLRAYVNQMDLFNSYAYSFDNKKRIFVKKQLTGDNQWKKIDSTFYDLNNRIIKFKSFQLQGYLGESRVNNITRFEEYYYEADKIVKTSYNTYTKGTPDIIFTDDSEINEYIYLTNGLLKQRICTNGNGEGRLWAQYIYEFYE